MLQDDRLALFGIDRESRRAEVEKMRRSVLCNDDVVRADISVQEVMLVHASEGLDDWQQQVARLFKRELAALGCRILHQVNALDVLHNEVRRAVLSEIVVYGNDIRNCSKLCEDPGFVEELRRAVIKLRLLILGTDRHGVVIVVADRNTRRQIFLYCHRRLERHIHRKIRHAESAHAENPAGQVAAIQDRPDRECDRRVLGRIDIKAAVRACAVAVVLAETSITNFASVDPHSNHPPLTSGAYITPILQVLYHMAPL